MSQTLDTEDDTGRGSQPSDISEAIIRIAGNSQDGIQSIGGFLARLAGRSEQEVMTMMTIPSTISGGPSIFQVRLGTGDVLSPGDDLENQISKYFWATNPEFNPDTYALQQAIANRGAARHADTIFNGVYGRIQSNALGNAGNKVYDWQTAGKAAVARGSKGSKEEALVLAYQFAPILQQSISDRLIVDDVEPPDAAIQQGIATVLPMYNNNN